MMTMMTDRLTCASTAVVTRLDDADEVSTEGALQLLQSIDRPHQSRLAGVQRVDLALEDRNPAVLLLAQQRHLVPRPLLAVHRPPQTPLKLFRPTRPDPLHLPRLLQCSKKRANNRSER